MGFHCISNTYLNFETICHITRRYCNSAVIRIPGQSGEFWTNYNPLSSPSDLDIDQITGVESETICTLTVVVWLKLEEPATL